MIRLKNFPIAYWPSPKVASTSIKCTLFALDNDLDAELVENVHEKMQAWSFEKIEDGVNVFKFAVIRDPIDRFIDAYCHRVLDLRELSEEFASKLPPIAQLKRRHLRTDPDIHWFIDHLEDYRFSVYAIEHHTDEQAKFIGRDPKYFDRLFLFSELSQIPVVLGEVLGRKVPLPHKMQTRAKVARNELRGSELRRLRDFYRNDYAMFELANAQA